MKPIRVILILICSLFFYDAFAQVTFNGDLEKIDPKTKLPAGWHNSAQNENYLFKVDNTVKQQGNYALSIESANKDVTFGAISYVLPYTFSGRQLQLKGFIKTENVTGGFAGLWLRIDGTTAFDNMAKQNVNGTTDWKEYTITLPYDDEEAVNINVGALMVGKGKMWVDNLRLYLDGKPIEKAATKKLVLAKAQQDRSFSRSSGISNIVINNRQIKNLTLLYQVWGFVKYHHPAVAKGDFNMDAELFRVMPSVIKAQNDKEASEAIERWIDKLGIPEHCENCKPYAGTDITQKPNYGEIFDKQVIS